MYKRVGKSPGRTHFRNSECWLFWQPSATLGFVFTLSVYYFLNLNPPFTCLLCDCVPAGGWVFGVPSTRCALDSRSSTVNAVVGGRSKTEQTPAILTRSFQAPAEGWRHVISEGGETRVHLVISLTPLAAFAGPHAKHSGQPGDSLGTLRPCATVDLSRQHTRLLGPSAASQALGIWLH